LAITYHAGRRIQGTSTDATAVSGGWKEVGRTTLGSAGDTITTSSLADKRYYMLLRNNINSGAVRTGLRLGNGSIDTGTNYAARRSGNGTADQTNTSLNRIVGDEDGSVIDFNVEYIANLSGNEKLLLRNQVTQQTAGAGNAPKRYEMVAKWANTSNPIDTIQSINTESGSFDTNSEIVVLGWDPDDTHTDNFWEELASDENSGSTGTIDTGTFTAKKYLMIMGYCANNSSGNMGMAFNNDLSTNYANRNSINGGSDTASASVKFIRVNPIVNTTLPFWWTSFVVNNSANEKLVINNVCYQSTAGAGTATQRVEVVGKWANTSSQITRVAVSDDSGSIITCKDNSFIKVWGSN